MHILLMKSLLNHCYITLPSVVARVGEFLLAEELFFDQPRADETTKRIGTTGLIIGTASASTAEGLLSNQSSGSLAVCREMII
jgi:hypothetical protein